MPIDNRTTHLNLPLPNAGNEILDDVYRIIDAFVALDDAVGNSVDKNLPGNPTTTTQLQGDSSTRIATTAFVHAAVTALINSAPGALDTLKELADALGDDANFATTVSNALAGKQAKILVSGLLKGDGSGGASAAVAGTDYLSPSGGTLTGAINYATSVSIASATTTDIGAATSNVITITGTTTITGLGTVAAGAERCVTFAGALTLTHNATSLILPGGANITTAAGDVAYFVSLGSGNWRCSGYQKTNGNSVVGGLTATGTAYETIAKGDALAWRTDGTGKIEKVQRRRIIPWGDVGTHLVQDCPHVTGPGNINFSANSGNNNVQYSIYDDTVLCAWHEVALGVMSYALYVCVGKIQADGSVIWGTKTVLTNAVYAGNASFGFQVVLLSTTLAGVICGPSTSTTFYYDKLVISGTIVNNVPGFASSMTLSYSSYLGIAGNYLARASSTVAMFHFRPNSGSTGQYGYIDFSTMYSTNATYNYSGTYIGYSGATVNGDNGFAGVLSTGAGSYLYISTLRSGNTLNTQAVNGEGVYQYAAIAYDGSRYAVIAYVKSANGYTYAKCYDAQSNVFGAEVLVYAGSLNNTDSMAYDSANSCFYLSTQALAGRVFTITNSGTTLTVGTNYQYTAPFYGITSGNNMSVNSYFSNFVSGSTNKQFVCSAATNLPYMNIYGYEQAYAIHRLVIIPHSPTNARNFCGIAEAAAVTNGSVTFTPDGGVTSSVSGLTANQQAMLSVDGAVGTSGYVQAGFAYSATSMMVCAAKNDFSRREIILYSKVWMPPPYVSRVRIVELTGGGAGAHANNATGFAAQGGQTVSGYVSITPNAGCAVVIGAGGTSSQTQASVTDGGVSSFASSSGVLATAVGGRKWVDTSYYLDRPGFLPWQNQGDLERRNGDTTTAYNSSIVESGGVAGSGRPGYGQAGGWNYAAATYRVTNGRQGVCIIEY